MSDFIGQYEMPLVLCDDVIEEFHSHPAQESNHTRGYSVVYSNQIDTVVTKLVNRRLREMIREYIQQYMFAFDGLEPTIVSEPWNIQHYVKYEYVKQPWFAAMPPELFKIMERALGWHLMITAKL